MNDDIPKRYQLRVKQRRRVVQYAELHGLWPASRHSGFARRTVRVWCRRWEAAGESGLVPRYPARRNDGSWTPPSSSFGRRVWNIGGGPRARRSGCSVCISCD